MAGAELGQHVAKRDRRAIFQLAKYMGRVSEERDLSLRAPKAGFDEVVRLTDGFNNMLGELEQRDHALKAASIAANEARASAGSGQFRQKPVSGNDIGLDPPR